MYFGKGDYVQLLDLFSEDMRCDSEMRFKGRNKIFIRLVLQLLGNVFNGELILMQQLDGIGHF